MILKMSSSPIRLSAPPLAVTNAVGSPVNPLALK
jgi:hypothetical protein